MRKLIKTVSVLLSVLIIWQSFGAIPELKANAASSIDLTSGMILNMDFEGTLNDSSGNNNNGHAYGGSNISYIDGKEGKALKLSGDGTGVEIPASDSLNLNHEMTVSFFARVDGTTPIYCLFARDNDFVGYCSYLTGDSLTMLAGNDHSKMNGGGYSYTYTPGQWFHVTLVISETTMTIYINKNKVEEKSLNSPMDFTTANGKNLYLGRFGSPWYYLDGALDNFKMYDRALSEDEVDALIDRQVTSISMYSLPTKTEYAKGELLDTSGGKITVNYSDGTSGVTDITQDMLSGYDSSSTGNKDINVSYAGAGTTFAVAVKPSLSNVTSSATVGANISATSDADGTLYLVPKPSSSYTTEAELKTAVNVKGVTANDTANTSKTISTSGLNAGDYQVYGVDSDGDVSAPVNVTLNLPATLDSTLSTMPDITEDISTDSNTGELVSDLLNGHVSGADGDTLGIAVTATDNTNGQWQYMMPNGQWWNIPKSGTVSEASALLIPSDAKIRFCPAINYNGAATITYRAWDEALGGNSEGSADVSVNGAGTAFSADESGAKISVTAVNDPPQIIKAGGKKALEFGGATGDYMQVPDMQLDGSFTCEAYVYINNATNYSRIFDFGSGAENTSTGEENGKSQNNEWFGFSGTSGKMEFQIFTPSSSDDIVTDQVLPTNQWVHVAVVFDKTASMGYIYWDGVLEQKGTIQQAENAVARINSYIGRSNWLADSYLQGNISDISFWNTAKSQSQIQQDMGMKITGNETGLVSAYDMTSGSGTTVSDLSPNGKPRSCIPSIGSTTTYLTTTSAAMKTATLPYPICA